MTTAPETRWTSTVTEYHADTTTEIMTTVARQVSPIADYQAVVVVGEVKRSVATGTAVITSTRAGEE